MLKKYTKISIFVLIAVVTFGFMFWYINKYLYKFFASTNNVTVAMSTAKETQTLNNEFLLTVRLSGQLMNGAELYLEYDASKLQYFKDYIVNVLPESGIVVVPPEYFDRVIIEKTAISPNQPVPTPGADAHVLKELTAIMVNTVQSTGNSVDINFKFKPKAVGVSTITLLAKSSVVGAAEGGNTAVTFELSPANPSKTITVVEDGGTITPSEGPTVSPSDGLTPPVTEIPTPSEPPVSQIISPPISGSANIKLNLKLKFQGITTLPKEGSRTMDVAVGVAPIPYVHLSREKIATFTAQGDGTWTGSVEFEDLPSYFAGTIYIKGPKHIKKKVCSNSPKEPVPGGYRCGAFELLNIKEGVNDLDFSSIVLLAGDLPIQNGVIDAVDIAFIRQTLRNQDTDKLQRGDLNLDGIIDTQDYSMVLSALGFKYDEE